VRTRRCFSAAPLSYGSGALREFLAGTLSWEHIVMKTLLAALAAALALTTAGASAQDYRRGRDHDWRDRDGYVITVRDHGRVMRFDESDRIFYRLLESPFGFEPGYTYVYTDECRNDQCQVIIYSPHRRQSEGRLWAPPIGHPRWFGGGYDDDDRYYRGRYRD
jgi:hypothetical protein